MSYNRELIIELINYVSEFFTDKTYEEWKASNGNFENLSLEARKEIGSYNFIYNNYLGETGQYLPNIFVNEGDY